MLKFTDNQIVFREVPNEVTLAINISGCPNNCIGCHSPELREDIGDELSITKIVDMVKGNTSISCIAFMGGDADPEAVFRLCDEVYDAYEGSIRCCWYSGNDEFNKEAMKHHLYYYKIGHYDANLGPLDKVGTNQKMLKVVDGHIEDLTYLIQKPIL